MTALRNRVGLTGVKEGCGTGDCGACSVTLDGRLVCSCLVLGVEAEGREVTTVEGLSKTVNCTCCSKSSLIMPRCSAVFVHQILSGCENSTGSQPEPDETEIRYALAGNLAGARDTTKSYALCKTRQKTCAKPAKSAVRHRERNKWRKNGSRSKVRGQKEL